ncbi:MAG: hypothetical protein OXG44_06395 [Gammaproteobacteria bacterium]|nr:hypothetical protein [Gammaproteobacteria bacterium]
MTMQAGRTLRDVLTSRDKLDGAKALYRAMLGEHLREWIDVAETLGDGVAAQALHDALDVLSPVPDWAQDGENVAHETKTGGSGTPATSK